MEEIQLVRSTPKFKTLFILSFGIKLTSDSSLFEPRVRIGLGIEVKILFNVVDKTLVVKLVSKKILLKCGIKKAYRENIHLSEFQI